MEGALIGLDAGRERADARDCPSDCVATDVVEQFDFVAFAVAIFEQNVEAIEVIVHRVLAADSDSRAEETGATDRNNHVDVKAIQHHERGQQPEGDLGQTAKHGGRRVEPLLSSKFGDRNRLGQDAWYPGSPRRTRPQQSPACQPIQGDADCRRDQAADHPGRHDGPGNENPIEEFVAERVGSCLCEMHGERQHAAIGGWGQRSMSFSWGMVRPMNCVYVVTSGEAMQLSLTARELLEQAPLAGTVLDSAGRLILANERFYELFGYERDRVDITATELTHPDDVDRTRAYISDLLAGSTEEVSIEKRYLRADGSAFWGRLTAKRMEVNGHVLLIGIIDDITKQHNPEVELEAAVNARSDFVVRVSHELRNGLHAISGLAELLASADIEAAERQQAETILNEVTALGRVVRDLVDIGRAEAGHLEILDEPFNVWHLVDQIVRVSEHVAAAKDLTVKAHIADAVPRRVMGDIGRVEQTLSNLMGNAVKFTQAGQVSIDVAESNDRLCFVVSDTGPGIPAEKRDLIFEPFGRVDATAPGSGLGLAIAVRLAEAMDGSLRLVDNDSPGAAFCFELPLRLAPDVVEPVETSRVAVDNSAIKPRILLVDDSPENQLLASSQLKRLGYEYDVAGDGFAALGLFEANPMGYGAILMDWHMPGIDGLETTRRIRSMEQANKWQPTSVIALTARAMSDDVAAFMQAGANAYVTKPAGLAAIGGALAEWALGIDNVSAEFASEGEPSADGVLDQRALAELAEDIDDDELLSTLMETFLQELDARVDAIETTDADTARRAAHTLKSTSAMLGAVQLSAAARAVEEDVSDTRPASSVQVRKIRDLAAATRIELTAVITKLKEGRP